MTIKNRHLSVLKEAEDEGFHLVLISAPAGYGKTTLTAAWLEILNADYLWISLEHSDNDLRHFCSAIVSSFLERFTGRGEYISALPNTPLLPEAEIIADMVAFEIEQHTNRLFFVFDNLHDINNPSVITFFQRLISIMPENLCMLLLSRVDPPLKLSRLRVSESITELRIKDLRLTHQEIKEFLSVKNRKALTEKELTVIEEKTEGWFAGVQLVRIALNESQPADSDIFLKDFETSQKYIIEYLAEEVLNQLPKQLRDFMLLSSLFNFFTAELCEAIFGISSSRKMINQLEKFNLLLHPMEESRVWYQYHPLLKAYLRAIAGERNEEEYIKTAKWYKKHGYIHEALQYTIKSGNQEEIFSILSHEAEKLFQNGEYTALSDWLVNLPDDFYSNHPEFYVYLGWSMLSGGNILQAGKYALSLLKNSSISFQDHDKARIECLSLLALLSENEDYCLNLIPRILEKTDSSDLFILIVVNILNGNIAFRHTQYQKAFTLYKKALQLSEDIANSYLTVCIIFNLSFVLIKTGEWEEAKQLCLREIERRRGGHNLQQPISEILYLPLSCIQKNYESDIRISDLNIRGQEACRKFSSELLISRSPSEIMDIKDVPKMMLDPLSKRELDVLRLIAKGYSNSDISETLFISLGTVKWHINNVFSKLNVKNRTQALLKAEEYKFI